MNIGNTTAHLAAAAVAAVMLAAALPTAMAQQTGKTVQPPKVQGAGAAVAKPAKPVHRAVSQNSRAMPAQNREWMLEDALPDRSAIMRQYEPVRSPEVGRVPLRSGPGTFGLATETATNPNRLPDGRPIPSLESNAQRSSSYVGLSLSVPTNDKAMNIPLPFGAPQ